MSRLGDLILEYIEAKDGWFDKDFHDLKKDGVLFSVSTSSESILEPSFVDNMKDFFELKEKDVKKIIKGFKEEGEFLFNTYDFVVEEISFSFCELKSVGSTSFYFYSLSVQDEDVAILEEFFS